MKKLLIFFLLSIVLSSCKNKKDLTLDNSLKNDSIDTEATLNTSVDIAKASELYLKVVKEHKSLKKDFNTLQINADISFRNNNLQEKINADIRIEKNKTILIGLKKFGITGAKIYITPNRVSYYEIINGSHYDGDFDFISNFLGTDLNFEQIQNVLIGSAIFNLEDEPLNTKLQDGVYKLYKETPLINMVYVLDGSAKLSQEVINQKGTEDKLIIDYLSYQTQDSLILPNQLLIRAIQDGETSIRVNYKKLDINPNISFPYKIPNGSKEIIF